jgi:hypothetical protein
MRRPLGSILARWRVCHGVQDGPSVANISGLARALAITPKCLSILGLAVLGTGRAAGVSLQIQLKDAAKNILVG